MARQSLQKVYADFRKGWVDVASPLQQPEGTVKDIVNFDINIDGTLSKRSGLERAGEIFTSTTGDNVETHLWENVGRDVNKKFLVLRRGSTFHFFDASDGNINLGAGSEVSTLTLSATKSVTKKRMGTASAMGRLFFAINDTGVGYFEYNASSNTVTSNIIDLKFRDLDLWEGPSRKATGFEEYSDFEIEPWHQYNLRNGGWPRRAAYVSQDANADEGVFEDADPVGYTLRQIGFWPRISIPFAAGRAGGGAGVDEQTAYSPWVIKNNYFGDSPPPVGRNIFSVSQFTRVGVLQTQTEGQAGSTYQTNGTHEETYTLSEHPSKVAFYAGRVWYAGDYDYSSTVNTSRPKAPVNGTGTIFFSQTIRNDIGNSDKCYQSNDPTAEDINQLLATDGGTLSIKEVGSIKALVPLSTALYVISDQGVWRITGLDFNSFSADSYSLDKVTDKGISSEDGFTVSENTLFLFNKDGLFAISSEGGVGEIAYNDISTPLIRNFFYSIPKKATDNVLLRYNKNRNIITCFLTIPEEGKNLTDEEYKTKYNTLLIFNADLGCFYKYKIDLGDNEILDAIDGLDTSAIFTQDLVFDSAEETYTDSSGEDYFLPGESSFGVNDITLHLFVREDSTTLYAATFSDSTDMTDLDLPYEATVEIGFDSIGNFISDKKQAPYILAYLETVFNGYEVIPPPPSASIAYIDTFDDELRAYGFNGSDWSLIGESLHLPTTGNPKLAGLNNTDVALVDSAEDLLRTYRFNGTSWTQLGNSLALSGVGVPTLVAINSADVAFIDASVDELRLYRFDGSDWAQVGNSLSVNGSGSYAMAALINNNVVLIDAFNDELSAYHFDGTDWVEFGNRFEIDEVSSWAITGLSATDIALVSTDTNEIRTYRTNGVNWSQVGNSLTIPAHDICDIATRSSNEIVFFDTNNDELRTYTFDGTNWSQVGNSFEIVGAAGVPSITNLPSE